MTKRRPMEILRKLAACAFSLALVTSLVPAAAFAAPVEPQVQPAEEATDPAPGPIAEGSVGEQCVWTIDANGELVIAPGAEGGLLGDIRANPWQDYLTDIKFVRIEPGVSSGEYLHGLFESCASLILADVSDLDTSKATDMSSLFEGCSALASTDLTKLNTANVTNMSSMFKGCSALRRFDIKGIDTTKVTRMESMFEGCSALWKLDLTGVITPSITNTQSMFAGCASLTSLDISQFTMTNVTAMKDMFAGCSSLATLELPTLDVEGVTDMSGVFSGCVALEQLNLSNVDTSGATTTVRMFEDCASLATLDLSNFNTTNVTDMSSMFAGCAALDDLNLSSFDTANVANMDAMFADCEALVDVDLGSHFAFKGIASALPAGSWLSLADSQSYTAQQLAERQGVVEGAYKRQMIFTSAVPDATEFTYDGVEKAPSVVVKSGDRTLVEGADYSIVLPADSTNAGEKTLNVNGAGAYVGAAQTIDYKINPATITEFAFDANELTYDGTEKVPGMIVKAGELTLDPKTDFDASLPGDITAVGEKTVSVTAKGNFEGTLDASYKIVPAVITVIEFDADKLTYDGAEKLPAITVKAGDQTLVAGTDYELTLPTDRVNAGKKTVKATAKGNYTGAVEASYEIVPAAINKVELSATKFTYDGKDKTPTVTVKCGDKTLKAGTDYDVTLPSDRVKVGKKTIKVTGKGNYTGMLEAGYEIVEAPKPDTPDTPDNPDNPDKPDTPDTPDTPDNPDKPAQVESVVMYRLYNPNSGEHFFTASTVERQHLISVGWNDEGQGWTAPKTGDAVYRLYNPNAGEHHYTLSTVERDSLITAGWNDEGIGWYSDPNHAVPLYRVYNPNEFANNHHYTTNDFERGYLVALGWFGEGIAWYGIG